LLAKILEIALVLRVVECLELIPQVPVLRDDLYLLDEDAIVEASLLFVHILVLLFLIFEGDLRNFRK